jgi:hypothetical protein
MLGAVDDAQLERTLGASDGWRAHGGGWQIIGANAAKRAQDSAIRLNERREAEAAPVLPTRTLSALVHLLRDSAYARVNLSHKLQQLAHLCASELGQLDMASEARSPKIAYLSADSAHNPGAIDASDWNLASDSFPKGVSVPSFGQEGAARCRALDDNSDAPAFELRRAVVTVVFPANESHQQQVGFACDERQNARR